MELPQEIQQRAERLAVLSPSARRVLEQELTVMVDDQIDIDPDAVRQELFIALINDLKFLGIYCTCTPGELYGPTWDDFDKKIEVFNYILPNQLYPRLQDDPQLRERLKHVLWGISDEPVLQAWLESLALYKPKLSEPCEWLIQNLNTSPIFTIMLDNMHDQIQQEDRKLQDTDSDPEWEEYKLHLHSQASIILKWLIEKLSLRPERVEFLKNRIQYSLFQNFDLFENVNKYKFLFLTQVENLSNEGQRYWRKVYYEFSVSNKLLPHYYTVRKILPSFNDVLGMIVYQFASAKSPKTLAASLSHIGSLFPHLNQDFKPLCESIVELKETQDVH